jgi:hypothetical protein
MKSIAPPLAQQGTTLNGRVHGGQQPISGARIYLMAANTAGYGAASISLLNGGATGHTDAIGGYVVTDAGGNFSITGDYSCSSCQQVYLLAVGGDTGAGENPASALMGVLGQCPAGSTSFLGAIPFLSVNEVTTVAGVYALSGYMTDMLHVSSSGTALANRGMANAFLTAASLADISSGNAYAVTPAGNGVAPRAKVNTLADILASCVNSNGSIASSPVPTSCYTLFSNATSDGTSSGSLPTETVTAALNVAHNPGANVANLFALASAQAPVQPTAPSVSDLTLALNFTGGGIVLPVRIAVDGNGDIWTTNDGTIRNGVQIGSSASKLAAGTGAALSPDVTGFNGGGISLVPASLAIDGSNNVWIGGPLGSGGNDGQVVKLSSDGTPMSSTGYVLTGAAFINALAIDSHGNAIAVPNGTAYKVDGVTGAVTKLVSNNSNPSFSFAISTGDSMWVGVYGAPGVLELDNTGAIVFPTGSNPNLSGTAGGLRLATDIAIDHAGNIWVANGGILNGVQQYGVVEFSSSGGLLSPGLYFSGGDDPLGEPSGIAIDGAGKVFVPHPQNSFAELNSSGSMISPDPGYRDSSLNSPNGIAVDGSGNVWIPNKLGSSVTEFVGVATPVVTPIAAGVANNALGTRP